MNEHIDAVAAVAESYRRRGYQVEIEPDDTGLPPFLLGFRPDLIARSASENVVIEVKVGS